MRDLSKRARKDIREVASIAYERELSAQLVKLQRKFDEWHRKEIDAFQLEQAIHVFHDGAARDLFKRYSPGAVLDHTVAGAVLRGTIQEEEVPETIRDHVMHLVAAFRSL